MTTTLAAPQKEQVTPTAKDAAPREYLWAADDFERACEAGAFGWDRRLELIHGRVIDRMPESPLHAFLVTFIIELLRAQLPLGLWVRTEKPIRIAFDGDPVPDISVVHGAPQSYRHRHPSPEDVVLLAEVAISSEEYDLDGKARLYAQAGISDYWVVLPEQGQIVVHRAPSPDGYTSVTTHGVGETISPLAASDATLAVAGLLGEDQGQ